MGVTLGDVMNLQDRSFCMSGTSISLSLLFTPTSLCFRKFSSTGSWTWAEAAALHKKQNYKVEGKIHQMEGMKSDGKPNLMSKLQTPKFFHLLLYFRQMSKVIHVEMYILIKCVENVNVHLIRLVSM